MGSIPFSSNRALRQTEAGLFVRMTDCIEKSGRATCRASKIAIFRNLEDYLEEFSDTSDLVLDNFRFIFLYYFIVCSLVFVAFAGYHLVKFAKKMGILIRSALRNYFARLVSGLLKLAE